MTCELLLKKNDCNYKRYIHIIIECEVEKWIGPAAAALQSLYWSVVQKQGAQFMNEALCLPSSLHPCPQI